MPIRLTSSRRTRALLAVVAAYVLFVLFVYAIAPSIVRDLASRKMSEALGRAVGIEEVRLNPFTLAATVRGFRVEEPSGGGTAFVSFDELYVNLEASSIIHRGLVVRELRLEAPYVRIERTGDNAYNFSDLLDSRGTPGADPGTGQPRFSVNNIRIEGAMVEVFDTPRQAHHVVDEIEVSLPFVSNLGANVETFVQPRFHARVNGSPLEMAGQSKPFVDTLETSMDIVLSDIDIPGYMKYYPGEPPVDLRSGRLGLDLKVSFLQKKGQAPRLLLTGLISLRDLLAFTRGGVAIASVPMFDIQIASSDVFARSVRLSSVSMRGAAINVERYRDGSMNLLTVLPPSNDVSGDGDADPPGDGPPFSLRVDAISIVNASATYRDGTFSSPYRTALSDMTLVVRDLATESGATGTYALSARKDLDEAIRAEGSFSLEPLASEGYLEISGLSLPRLGPIYRGFTSLVIEGGRLGVSGRYAFDEGRSEGPVTVSGGAVTLEGLRVRGPVEGGIRLLSIEGLAITNIAADPGLGRLSAGELRTSGGDMTLRRLADGSFEALALLKPPGPPGPAAGAEAGEPWLVELGSMRLSRYAVRIIDEAPPGGGGPFELSVLDIGVSVDDLSTGPGRAASVKAVARVEQGGSISMAGQVTINPLALDVSVKVADLGLWIAEPYIKDRLDIVMAYGYLDVSGRVSYDALAERAGFQGEAGVRELLVLDGGKYENVIGWKALSAGGIRASTNPGVLDIARVELAGLSASLGVEADGSTNVSRLFIANSPAAVAGPPPAVAADASADARPPWRVSIGEVVLRDGTVEFSDESISPAYRTSLKGMEGTVSGLSTGADDPARVRIGALWDGTAPVEIAGTLGPFKTGPGVDIALKLSNVDLTSLTPYSGTFAGLAIAKGKMFLEVSTRVRDAELTSENKVFMDQFEFGTEVQSERALRLPYRFAVALLKDRKGEIHIDLPVSGRTDDPEFSYGGLVIDIIINLVTKAATSPFSLIASMLGGEELSSVGFEGGRYAIEGEGAERLRTLARVMGERPGLRLEARGFADRALDEAGLRDRAFERKLKAARHRELLRQGVRGATLEEVIVAPQERPKYLALAYKAEAFEKPRNALGFVKGLPDAEMERLIREHIVITDDDLMGLAVERARAAIAFLSAEGGVEPERLFLIEGDSPPEAAADAGGRSAGRVEFTLK